ncbi:LysM peptidoglycan-binding domain-containing protein [Paenibacillus sp. LMG 31458]|uniref:LysM peptidoglycan-binding domain-containing protein n=2 Tax=Paenibacillus phytorum TaxID=2654977 RepID=A0ABX1Y0N4_9BACL|nr:LysM peptidoglycan-binding domain-containing protein [Paenibacillus phytorum]
MVSGNDTMWLISQKYGISLSSLIKANPQVANPNVIWSGMSLNIPGSTSTNAGTKTPVTTAPSQTTFASQVVNLVNQERSKAGLRPLTSNSALTAMALDKAKDMYNNGYFDHTSPTYGSPFDMMSTYGIRYSYAGENIAKGQQTPEAVMKAWMNSTGHRQNILSPNFTQIGVAFYNGEWVQEFISN